MTDEIRTNVWFNGYYQATAAFRNTVLDVFHKEMHLLMQIKMSCNRYIIITGKKVSNSEIVI